MEISELLYPLIAIIVTVVANSFVIRARIFKESLIGGILFVYIFLGLYTNQRWNIFSTGTRLF